MKVFLLALLLALAPAAQAAPELRLPELTHAPKAYLFGYYHMPITDVPAGLARKIAYFQQLGLTDLVLEMRPLSPAAAILTELLAQHTSAELEKMDTRIDWSWGPHYTFMVKKFLESGFRITYGDLDEKDGGTRGEMPKRNQNFKNVLTRLMQEGRRPLLLVGNDHIRGIAQLFFEAQMEQEVFPLSEATYYEKEMPGHVPCDAECEAYPRTSELRRYFGHLDWRLR